MKSVRVPESTLEAFFGKEESSSFPPSLSFSPPRMAFARVNRMWVLPTGAYPLESYGLAPPTEPGTSLARPVLAVLQIGKEFPSAARCLPPRAQAGI